MNETSSLSNLFNEGFNKSKQITNTHLLAFITPLSAVFTHNEQRNNGQRTPPKWQ